MVGEGLDMEAFIDSEAFAEIKDCIEDSTGDELLKRIKEVYPDLDLAFLTAGGSDSPHGSKRDQEVDPNDAGSKVGEHGCVEPVNANSSPVDPDSNNPLL